MHITNEVLKFTFARNCKLFPTLKKRNSVHVQITEWTAIICSPEIFVSRRKVPVSAPVHWNCKVFLGKKKSNRKKFRINKTDNRAKK